MKTKTRATPVTATRTTTGPTATITNCTFTTTQAPENLEVALTLAQAALENAKAIQAAAKLFTPEAMLKVGHMDIGTA
jgi:hypothetical protein